MRAKNSSGGWKPVIWVLVILAILIAGKFGMDAWANKQDAKRAETVESDRLDRLQKLHDANKTQKKIQAAREKLDNATTESEKLIARRELEKLLEKSDR